MTTRYLMHTIDSTTLTAGRRQSTGKAGTYGVVIFTLMASGLLIWADRFFV